MVKKKEIKDVEVVEEKVTETSKIEDSKKEKPKKEKKERYLKKVRTEMKKVVWPSFKEIAKYSLAVIIFCIALAGFFYLVYLLSAFITNIVKG